MGGETEKIEVMIATPIDTVEEGALDVLSDLYHDLHAGRRDMPFFRGRRGYRKAVRGTWYMFFVTDEPTPPTPEQLRSQAAVTLGKEAKAADETLP